MLDPSGGVNILPDAHLHAIGVSIMLDPTKSAEERSASAFGFLRIFVLMEWYFRTFSGCNATATSWEMTAGVGQALSPANRRMAAIIRSLTGESACPTRRSFERREPNHGYAQRVRVCEHFGAVKEQRAAGIYSQ